MNYNDVTCKKLLKHLEKLSPNSPPVCWACDTEWVKLLLLTFYLNGRLHPVSVGKPS